MKRRGFLKAATAVGCMATTLRFFLGKASSARSPVVAGAPVFCSYGDMMKYSHTLASIDHYDREITKAILGHVRLKL